MFILIDKPKGMTSHDVVDGLRTITGERRIGHAGTLDPNASGLLILGIGRNSTKKLSRFLKLDKEYDAEIFLGEERDTDDILGNSKFKSQKLKEIEKSRIENVLKRFVGEQMQIPPAFSAIKIGGKKAYDMARKGIKLELKQRKIVIYKIKLIDYKFPILKIRTKVSSGTYIRSLARDLGRDLGCGAFLLNLRRRGVGKYKIGKAIPLSDLKQNSDVISEGFEF